MKLFVTSTDSDWFGSVARDSIRGFPHLLTQASRYWSCFVRLQ